jgi:hypothetical protein
MKLLKIAVLSAALLASGCAATEMVWQRIDGRPLDRTGYGVVAECRRLAYRYEESAVEVMQTCMTRRGYVWAAAPTAYSY